MKYLDEYRDGMLGRRLMDEIRRLASRRWSIMEVCGGQTHSSSDMGLKPVRRRRIDSRAGVPGLVTPVEAIDFV
jgi:hydrogenase expression/formation protein HypD